jgi:carbon-monoxide dehydrogenase medium subunit
MLLKHFEYARPSTVARALELLASDEDARLLAGGQSLLNVLKQRAGEPELLVDLAAIEDLRGIRARPDGALELGAMTTYSSILASAEVGERRPIVARVIDTIADVQVRNRGTVGGNVCANDPTNHLPPLMVALGATMRIRGAGGVREVAADDFFLGVFETAVGQDELLETIVIPGRQVGQGDAWAAHTLGRDGTGIVTCAATVTVQGDRVSSARVVLGCIDIRPVRLTGLEAALAGTAASESAVAAVTAGSASALEPPGDVHAAADFRRHLAEVLARRAVLAAIEEAR